jgi:hypothetical protein
MKGCKLKEAQSYAILGFPMIPNETDALMALQHAFTSTRPPKKITQEAFDGDSKHLDRLVQLRAGDQPEVRDLWKYTQDLMYTEIQGPLLAYVLPFCLEAWHGDLHGTNSGYGGFVEQLYPVLANKHVFDRHLMPAQSAAVSEFMRDSILAEIDDQRGLTYQGTSARPYRWITALTTQGVLTRDMDRLWTAWWSIDTVGRAIGAVQYISCLMYPVNENPVFAPWTPDGGGGPPCLWEFGGHLYTHRWLEENVHFLRQLLNPQGACAVLTRAVTQLVDQTEHKVALDVQADLPLCAETLASRCIELPDLLATTQGPGKAREWAT